MEGFRCRPYKDYSKYNTDDYYNWNINKIINYNLFDQNVTFYMKKQDIENIQHKR